MGSKREVAIIGIASVGLQFWGAISTKQKLFLHARSLKLESQRINDGRVSVGHFTQNTLNHGFSMRAKK
jgi:hypothetical protein